MYHYLFATGVHRYCPIHHSCALLSYGVTATIRVIISRLTLDWARKSEFNILIAFLHISGLLIYLELKIKNSFLKIIKKLITLQSTMLFGYIFINHIQPFEAANISAAFFLCRPMRKHNHCHTFQNKFQDDISCTLVV